MRSALVLVWFSGACNGGSTGLPTGDTATGTTSTGAVRYETILALPAAAADGTDEYSQQCAVCHPSNGDAGPYPALSGVVPALTDLQLVTVVVEGVADPSGQAPMPPYDEYFTNQQIADLVAYMRAVFPSG